MKKPNIQHLGITFLLLFISYSCSTTEDVSFTEDFDRAKMDQLFANSEEKDLG